MSQSAKGLPFNLLRALHRPPALRTPNANDHATRPELQNPKPAQQARALGADHEGKAPSAGRPHVCFILRRVKLLDVDAKYGSTKDLLDGLTIAKIIPGDREDQITLEVRQEKVGHYKDEETVIEITQPAPSAAAPEQPIL